jgi:hypothetical protein
LTSANALDTIRFNSEGFANEIDESDRQLEKHFDPRSSTLFGIKIDSSDEDENASDSIHVNREGNSNEFDESDSQYEKQLEPRSSRLFGIKID